MKSSRLSISTILDSVTGKLEAHLRDKKRNLSVDSSDTPPYAGIIFSGNPHETVPRRLLLDDRLTPLERNTWQVFRLLINDDGLTAFPTYDQLRPYLGMQPGKPASRETISKALVTLRLTRWLSLGRRVRNDLTGQIQGNVYLLHDEPVTPAEALEFDKDYLHLLGQSINHHTKVIREVAEIAWNEFSADPDVGQRLPSRVEIIETRLNEQSLLKEQALSTTKEPEFGIPTQHSQPLHSLSSDAELSENMTVKELSAPSSESELSRKTQSSDLVRIPNSYSTYTNTNNVLCKSSVHVPTACDETAIDWLETLKRLPEDQKNIAVEAIQKVPAEIKPGLIRQWAHRCNAGGVRKPLGYLLKLVGSAIRGDFNSRWNPGEPATEHQTISRAPAEPSSHDAVMARHDVSAKAPNLPRSAEAMQTANQQLSEMMNLLRHRQLRPPQLSSS